MQYIYYKTNPQNSYSGTGFCSFMGACPTPVNLVNVNGTMTITDRENKIKLTITDNVVSVPILIDDNIRGRVPITIQEKQMNTGEDLTSGNSFGFGRAQTIFQTPTIFQTQTLSQTQTQTQTQQSLSSKIYTLSVGKSFKTSFIVRNREFSSVHSKSDGLRLSGGLIELGGSSSDVGYPNVLEMNLSFGVEGDMQLVNSLPTSLPSQ